MLAPTPDLLASINWEQAFGGTTGHGVKVGIIDSGIDNGHKAVNGAVKGWAEPVVDAEGEVTYGLDPHGDMFGHGTACAGVIHSIAPEADLYSIKVLGKRLNGKGAAFAAGLRWAIDNEMDVDNLSLGATKQDFFSIFHELTDEAYFKGISLVTAANNMPVLSFPSLYAAVLSVACYEGKPSENPLQYYANPSPPVEFGAEGIDVRVAWLGGGYITATGNSFAAPRMAGIVALLLGKFPDLTPFQVKTVLQALAGNVR
jgi:subtilisin family serine protease